VVNCPWPFVSSIRIALIGGGTLLLLIMLPIIVIFFYFYFLSSYLLTSHQTLVRLEKKQVLNWCLCLDLFFVFVLFSSMI